MKQPPLPVGEVVTSTTGSPFPSGSCFEGQFVTLSPLNPASDVEELYEISHGSEEKEIVWTYMGYGPFGNAEAMRNWLLEIETSRDPLFLTVTDRSRQQQVGMVSFLNIVPEARRLELGHIWYSPEAQRTQVNTEAVYLMLSEAFDRLKCRRVEWKCDSLNERSRAAAVRLGFQFEGIFRQHLIVKGRNRDTAWFAMLDGDWPTIKSNMEHWLYENEDRRLSLRELNNA